MVSEPDISAHEGLVRCGNCYSVFNAGANLTDDPHASEDAEQTASPPGVSNTAFETPTGASAVSTSSDFTFNFVEDEPEQAGEIDAEDSSLNGSPEDEGDVETAVAAPEEKEMEPFPRPDFQGEILDNPAASASTEEDNSLLYFGPDQAEEQSSEPEASTAEPDPVENSLLQANVFNPATSNDADQSASESPEMEIDEQAGVTTDMDAAEKTDDEESYAGPEISEQADETDSDFAMPDFSPLEGLDQDSANTEFAAADDQQDDVEEVECLETRLDDESLWPGEEEAYREEADPLPDPTVNPRYLADETHDALQAYDDSLPDMGLETPGMDGDEDMTPIGLDEPETAIYDEDTLAAVEIDELPAAEVIEPEPEPEPELEPELDTEGLDPGDDDMVESVFITSEEEETDEAYQAMNVEHDKAYHDHGGGDFPLPDELDDFDNLDNPDIEKLLKQSADAQVEIDAKLAETEANEPEMGTPDIDDDAEDEPLLGPAADQTENGSPDSPGLMQKFASGIGYVADRLHIGRRSYHGLDTYETQEHQDTLLVRQLEHESHGSLFSFISPGMRRILLLLANLALIALLVFQTGKYFMDDLAQIKVLRPVLEAGCQLAGCRVPTASRPAAIEQLSSKMTVLDGQKDGLRIAVTLINRDSAEQPFPAMELSLTDRGGRIISRRIVKADQYRGTSAEYKLMQPGQAEDVNILLRTPAVRVDGFELRPVKLHWLDPR